MFFCSNCHNLLNIKKSVDGSTEQGHFYCNSCGYNEKIDNSSLIYQSKPENSTEKIIPELATLDIYQQKIIDKCTNKKCKTKKNPRVVIYKDNNFNVKYICMSCHTII